MACAQVSKHTNELGNRGGWSLGMKPRGCKNGGNGGPIECLRGGPSGTHISVVVLIDSLLATNIHTESLNGKPGISSPRDHRVMVKQMTGAVPMFVSDQVNS